MDLIERQAAIDAIKDADVCVAWNGEISSDDAVDIAIKATKRSVIASIEELPSAQPEIIHCKDCKFWSNDIIQECIEWNNTTYWEPFDFCSKAERKEE